MTNNYVVRMVLPDGVHDLTGLIRTFVRLQARSGLAVVHRDSEDGMCFDLIPPAGVTDSKEWANKTAATFEGYCFNAVRAPACPKDCDDGAWIRKVASWSPGPLGPVS